MHNEAPIRVIIVDDCPQIARCVAAFLSDFGFDVSVANTAESALGQITGTSFDIAIVDAHLPDMTGEQLILLAHGISPQLWFLVHTGDHDYSLSQELLEIGVCHEHIFRKPLMKMKVLVEAINHRMRRNS